MREKTLIKIAVATNPLTWIYFALAFMCLPIEYLLKKSGIHDIWFIYFRIPKLGNVMLDMLEYNVEHRMSLKRNAWFRWIDRKAMNRIVKSKKEWQRFCECEAPLVRGYGDDEYCGLCQKRFTK